jgi:hypothetical protein
MTLPHPIQHPESYFLVQFSLDDNGYMQPLHVNPLQHCRSPHHPDLPFVGVRGSKYGVRKKKNATHWALMCLDDNDVLTLVHRGSINALISRKRIMPFGHGIDAFISARGSAQYFSMAITKEAIPANIPVRAKLVNHLDNI